MNYSHGELVQLAEEGRRKKMPRYIDADKLLARYKERCEGCKETKTYCEHCCDIADVIDDIEDAPTLDVVKGVRCLLCEHLDPTSPSGTVEPTFYFCKRRKIYVDPYDCCAFGDRREEKTDAETN